MSELSDGVSYFLNLFFPSWIGLCFYRLNLNTKTSIVFFVCVCLIFLGFLLFKSLMLFCSFFFKKCSFFADKSYEMFQNEMPIMGVRCTSECGSCVMKDSSCVVCSEHLAAPW